MWPEIHPFTGGGGEGGGKEGEVKKVSEKYHIEGFLDVKSPQTSSIVYYPGTLSLQGHIIFTKFRH